MYAALLISCMLGLSQPSLPDSVEISKRTYPIRDLQWGEATIEEFTVRNNSSTRVATWIDYETDYSGTVQVCMYFLYEYRKFSYTGRMIDSVMPIDYYTSYNVGGCFLKLIDPGASFKYIVYLIEPIDYNCNTSMDHIFVYKEEEVSKVMGFLGNPLPSWIEEQLYHEPYLIILNPTDQYRNMAEGEVRAPRAFARHRRARKQSKTYENECSNNNLMPFGSGPTIPSGQR